MVVIAKTFARYRGHLGPSGQKLQIEFENGFPGPEPKKSKTESKKSQNSRKIVDFASFSTPFCTFGPRGRALPGNPFSNSICNFRPEGPK